MSVVFDTNLHITYENLFDHKLSHLVLSMVGYYDARKTVVESIHRNQEVYKYTA